MNKIGGDKMNKRQKKKCDKKFGLRSYYEVRRHKVYMAVSKYSEEIGLERNPIVYIIDSRRMDLKHPIKISLISNAVPISASLK